MKQIGLVTLLSALACAAAPVSPPVGGPAIFATSKSVAQFGGCFVADQQRASRPWFYVPNIRGGSFSNLGVANAAPPYFLAVSDRGGVRELRLEPAQDSSIVDAGIARAVARCV